MPTIKPWLLGRHHTTMTITGQTVAAGGALTDSATIAAVIAVADSIESILDRDMDEISAATAVRKHNVPVVDGHSLNVSIIEVNDLTDPDPLHALTESFDFVKVVWVRGTQTGSILTTTAYYAWQTHRVGMAGKGQQIASMSLVAIDTGADSYARVKT